MKKLILLILILSFFLYCESKQDKVDKIIEDGVEVVINHIEPYRIKGEPSQLILEEEVTIDTERDDIVEKGLTDIQDFDVDSAGQIYFLNFRGKENVIFKFSKNGNFISSFGRKGQGPGELQWATYLNISNHDEIMIIDHRRIKLLSLNKDGRLIKEIPSDINYGYANLLGKGNYLIFGQESIANRDLYNFLLLCNSELEKVKELDRQNVPNIRLGQKRKATRYIFNSSVSNESIYVGNSEKGYEILIYDLEGNLCKKIRKDYEPVEVSEELKRIYRKPFKSPFYKNIYFPEYMPPFQYFFTDDKSYLYVMTYEKGGDPREYMYDIFNPDGIFIGKMSLGNTYARKSGEILPLPVRMKNNRLYCLREKESGYKELVVYKMKWE